ncbi:DNA-directed RNA polymerase subunit omega [Candidatus Aerophobetes bacterium]|nr:DNA-directed RNA polymerase subunit omega [Candidatus Aerophobetes bacterium]
MIKFSTDDLLRKSGIEDKYELTRLAIRRIRQLVKEKDKMALEDTREKLPILVLKEIAEGKLKPESLEEESQEKETPPSTEK